MREIRLSGSEGGGAEFNRLSLPLFITSGNFTEVFSLVEAVTRTLHNFCARSAGGLASGTIQTRQDTSKVTSEKFSEVKDDARTKRRHSPRAPSIAGGRVPLPAVAREAATVKAVSISQSNCQRAISPE